MPYLYTVRYMALAVTFGAGGIAVVTGLAVGLGLARSVLANSWFSNRANKRLVDTTDGLSLTDGLPHEIENSPGIAPDARERMAQFGSKG